jgi:hypothetical protein
MFLFLSVEYKYMPDFYQNQALHQLPKYTADMAPKRPIEDDAVAPQSKKHRTGFKVGPDNLPDGTYRRKGKRTRSLHQD